MFRAQDFTGVDIDFRPNIEVWGFLLQKGNAPGSMGGTRICELVADRTGWVERGSELGART